MSKTLANYRLDRRWEKFLPWSVFMPWFFTDEGNKYRVRLLMATGLFALLIASGFALGFINESVRPTGANNKPAVSEGNPSSNPVFKEDNRNAARPSTP